MHLPHDTSVLVLIVDRSGMLGPDLPCYRCSHVISVSAIILEYTEREIVLQYELFIPMFHIVREARYWSFPSVMKLARVRIVSCLSRFTWRIETERPFTAPSASGNYSRIASSVHYSGRIESLSSWVVVVVVSQIELRQVKVPDLLGDYLWL